MPGSATGADQEMFLQAKNGATAVPSVTLSLSSKKRRYLVPITPPDGAGDIQATQSFHRIVSPAKG
jgi:hypothetical protein